ncbi:MAG: hypothetical protein U0R80_00505 [Nocardioidaceae bacterium]
MGRSVRQAVVVIHGMGEQLPLSTLTRFIDTALRPKNEKGDRTYFSRPESVTGSYESRRFLAPRFPPQEDRAEWHAQTDFFEYHWADKMQGNRLDDLWPTFRRMLLQWPTRVPHGIKALWFVGWALILTAVWAVGWGPLEGKVIGEKNWVTVAITALVSGGVVAAALSYGASRLLPRWLTSSFVDVVRYLDTSPRSYEVRREIRKGLVEMLQALHDSTAPRYDRVVIVAHSLGAYIGYDAIAYLWGLMNAQTGRKPGQHELEGLLELELAASALPDRAPAQDALVASFQQAQRDLWLGSRRQGNPWLISDFVSVGTPMYFADQLMFGKGGRSFAARIDRRELPTCPPHNEESERNNIHKDQGATRFYSWEKSWSTGSGPKRKSFSYRVLYEGAPFAVVRWTNLWFPVRLGLFGDWFGGPLAPLFGCGIKDVPLSGNTWGLGASRSPGTKPWLHRLVPAAAHAFYFSFPADDADGSAAKEIRRGVDLASTSWLRPPVPRLRPRVPRPPRPPRRRARAPAAPAAEPDLDDSEGAQEERDERASPDS